MVSHNSLHSAHLMLNLPKAPPKVARPLTSPNNVDYGNDELEGFLWVLWYEVQFDKSKVFFSRN